MSQLSANSALRLALPKGRMDAGVRELLRDAGVRVRSGAREYRPEVSIAGFDTKILKPQSIVQMLMAGSRDVGFTGADWVRELGGYRVVELLDTGLDPVRLVAAAPGGSVREGRLTPASDGRPLVIASEFERLTRRWISERGLNATFVRSYGATEVYPPEDADCIVDLAASGATLQANGLEIFDTLAESSTRLYASSVSLERPSQRARIEDLVLLLRSVLEARRRVMLEVNVTRDALQRVAAALPCMREPTISPLHGEAGFAVKAAVPRDELVRLIPEIKRLGGTDIVVSTLSKIIP